MLRLRPTGRGRRYSLLRGALETAATWAFPGDWPARLWGLWPAARRVDLVTGRLAVLSSAPPLRIAFASDLHLGPVTAARTLDRAFARLAEAAPDVLILGGDYVYLEATPRRVRELAARVAAVPARTKVAVLGNHDLWARHGRIEAALADAGVHVLVNRGLRLPPPHGEVAVLGLDDPWSGDPDPEAALDGVRSAPVKVAVAHAPEALPMLEGRGVALLLCGHTHGGQIALPGPRPVIVPGPLGRRYPAGTWRFGELTMFVSRGVGGVELPLRAHAPPDVAIFDLLAR